MSKHKQHRPQHNPPDPARMERREALKAIRTVLRNSVSTQATYSGTPFDVMLAVFKVQNPVVASMFSDVASEAPTHPNASRFKAFAEAAAKHGFTWNDLALRELNLTPGESAAELNRVTRERDALLAEVASLRGGGNVVAAMLELVPLATRAYRAFERWTYDGGHLPDDAAIDANDPSDADAMPSVSLTYNIAGVDGAQFQARVDCIVIDPGGEEDDDHTVIAFGNPSASPAEAFATLRDALGEEPDEDGVRVTAEARAYFAGRDAAEAVRATPTSNERPN